MIVIRQRDNWLTVEQEGEVVFEGAIDRNVGLDGDDLKDILEGVGAEVRLEYTPGEVPRD